MSRLAAVVIGRDEGAKLGRCLASVAGKAAPVVYVDSGSVDGSVVLARRAGAEVVALDPSTPFTVARARNEGFAHLMRVDPDVEFVQFVDADSEMAESWFEPAVAALAAHPECAVVCGRLRERSPRRSLYTRLYGVANDARLADPNVSSGIAMMRASAFRQVGGFVPWMVGFEDREISTRLRQAGWQVRRLNEDMAVHDAGMKSVGEWWRRRVKGGRSLAQEAALRRRLRAHASRSCLSVWFWGLALPGLALAAAWPTRGASLLLFSGHVGLAARIYRRTRRLGFDRADASLYAAGCTAAKIPNALGLLRYCLERTASRLRLRPGEAAGAHRHP